MRKLIQRRADFFRQIRLFFAEKNVLEVDTPLLAKWGNPDPNLPNLKTESNEYLQTSPEFAMKVLLSQNSGDIYQLNHVFRAGEFGKNHRQEFMMLEWYRLGFNHYQLMNEVSELIFTLIPEFKNYPIVYYDYAELFQKHLNLNLSQTNLNDLKTLVGNKLNQELDLDFDGHLDLLFSYYLQPHLGQNELAFVVNYPPSQASLAKLLEVNNQLVAGRFELFIHGLELCNGFWELTDAQEQAQRFQRENQKRLLANLPEIQADEMLLKALKKGLPDCAGVALGIDRLLMLKWQKKTIDEVYPNLILRAEE